MSYKVIVDSCGELTPEMKQSGKVFTAPLTLNVGGYLVVDDDTFDQADFLERVAKCSECPKSSCPSPEAYMKAFQGEEERVYVVTLSAELSGSYNSAVLGKNLFLEEHGEKEIYVFNSRSASVGETLITKKIMECEEQGMSFQEVIDAVETYIDGQNTYFVLESLETLRKNGRLTGLKALAASVLNIKPVMGATKQGVIIQHGQARGIHKALVKMVDRVAAEIVHPEEKTLGIAHCNCPARAEMVKEMLRKKIPLKEIIVLDTRGVSSMYANDGGVIIAV
nr:DegV family protein [uncultured Sellimonas sp.]